MSNKRDYGDHRDDMAGRSRQASAQGREIGPLPAVADPERKERCRGDLMLFNRTYFPRRFKLEFGEPHLVATDRMQNCTLGGGLFACAMPRGTGKTTLAECAVIWALVYGYRLFIVLICAVSRLAERRLKQIQYELETNELLLADFPEVCYPIRCLERIHNRAKGQTLNGHPTRIEFRADGLILPTVAGSPASGSIVQTAGMEGAIRGMNILSPEGDPLRPDLALIDDAQTRESAKSIEQTADREAIIGRDVLGLAGPDTTIAALMLCTVIYPGDLSDRFLSPEAHPEWQGVRTQMIEAWPENMEAWDRYGEVLRESLKSGNKGVQANEYYIEHREVLDKGCRVSWSERFKRPTKTSPGEISGIQSAMNLWILDRKGFLAEYQNKPEIEGLSGLAKELHPDAIVTRLSGLIRGEVPGEGTRITAFIDPGGSLHWFAVCAWDDQFGGSVIDYGCWPPQSRSVFAHTDARPSIANMYPKLGDTARVYASLGLVVAALCTKVYLRQGNSDPMRIERILIDGGWETATIHKFCRESPLANVLLPSKGFGRSNTTRSVSEWKARAGERSGDNWRLTPSETTRSQHVQFDTDCWKSFVWERFTTPMGGRGAMTLFNNGDHTLYASHLAAEWSQPQLVRGIEFDQWTKKSHNPDNHLLDCTVGCAVAASVQGLVWTPSGRPARDDKPQRVKWSEVQARKDKESP